MLLGDAASAILALVEVNCAFDLRQIGHFPLVEVNRAFDLRQVGHFPLVLRLRFGHVAGDEAGQIRATRCNVWTAEMGIPFYSELIIALGRRPIN